MRSMVLRIGISFQLGEMGVGCERKDDYAGLFANAADMNKGMPVYKSMHTHLFKTVAIHIILQKREK